MERITAIFNDPITANQAVTELHQLGLWKVFFLQPHNRPEGLLYQKVNRGTRRGWIWGAFAGVVFGGMVAVLPGLGAIVQQSTTSEMLSAFLGGMVSGGLMGGWCGLLTGAVVEASFRRELALEEKAQLLERIYLEVDVESRREEGEASEVLQRNGGHLFSLQQV